MNRPVELSHDRVGLTAGETETHAPTNPSLTTTQSSKASTGAAHPRFRGMLPALGCLLAVLACGEAASNDADSTVDKGAPDGMASEAAAAGDDLNQADTSTDASNTQTDPSSIDTNTDGANASEDETGPPEPDASETTNATDDERGSEPDAGNSDAENPDDADAAETDSGAADGDGGDSGGDEPDADDTSPPDAGECTGAGGICIDEGLCEQSGGTLAPVGGGGCQFSGARAECCIPQEPETDGASCNDQGGVCTSIGGCLQADGYFTPESLCDGVGIECCVPFEKCGTVDIECCTGGSKFSPACGNDGEFVCAVGDPQPAGQGCGG